MENHSTLLFIILSILVLNGNSQRSPIQLQTYHIDKGKISVSGLSSGAFFSVQFHVAFSRTIMGAGIIAGGPFWCANNNIDIATTACMVDPVAICVSELVSITYEISLTGAIDPPSYLNDSRVYLFSGILDTVIVQGVARKLGEYYSSFLNQGNLFMKLDIPAEHSIVTSNYGNPCPIFKSPYINNCNYSTAYHILQHIYKDIKTADVGESIKENLLDFDQSEFFAGNPELISIDNTGYIYIPTNCQSNSTKCRLHLVFHGCKQGRIYLSDTFALHAGYNELAEKNDIIIIYPQARTSVLNPYGCWDWWGYTSTAYASKLGPQMAGIKVMLDRAAGI